MCAKDTLDNRRYQNDTQQRLLERAFPAAGHVKATIEIVDPTSDVVRLSVVQVMRYG